jgi:hypothetical protein
MSSCSGDTARLVVVTRSEVVVLRLAPSRLALVRALVFAHETCTRWRVPTLLPAVRATVTALVGESVSAVGSEMVLTLSYDGAVVRISLVDHESATDNWVG